jgi:excisionase family DNA binding protein
VIGESPKILKELKEFWACSEEITTTMNQLLTSEEVAARLGVKLSTVRQWVHERYIPHVKLGRSVRFDPRVIEEWVKKCSKEGRTERGIDLGRMGL